MPLDPLTANQTAYQTPLTPQQQLEQQLKNKLQQGQATSADPNAMFALQQQGAQAAAELAKQAQQASWQHGDTAATTAFGRQEMAAAEARQAAATAQQAGYSHEDTSQHTAFAHEDQVRQQEAARQDSRRQAALQAMQGLMGVGGGGSGGGVGAPGVDPGHYAPGGWEAPGQNKPMPLGMPGAERTIAPIANIDNSAADAAAFAQAKDKTGQVARGAMTGLNSALASRGQLGSGAAMKQMTSAVMHGAGDMGQVARDQAIEHSKQANTNAGISYNGAVTQRGQDSVANQAALDRASRQKTAYLQQLGSLY